MTIPEAIEVLRADLRRPGSVNEANLLVAELLGFEALQRILVGRNNPGSHWNDPLPGEAE